MAKKTTEETRTYQREWRRRNPEVDQEYQLKRKYGISSAERDAMSKAQSGRCAVCGGPPNGRGRKLHVDHDHRTGKVRKLLCFKCNSALGNLDDNPDRMIAAAEYIRKFQVPAGVKAAEWLNQVADMVQEKGISYGNSIGNPVRIFSKAGDADGIRVRIDDKISRLARAKEYPGDDTLKDLVGYIALLAVTENSNSADV